MFRLREARSLLQTNAIEAFSDPHQMNKNWRTKETRCEAHTSSGKRCKLRVEAGEYLCEHHQTDLPHFVAQTGACVGIMQSRFPKRHHPACDRKGQNDCNCHTYSNGALGMMALREAFKKSQELSPLYRKKRNLEHQLKVKKIRAYYNSITEAELWLPKDAGFRQFRFFIWDSKSERIVVRVIKDNFRHKSTLLKWLRKLAPLHVYYTTSAWLNPQGIGPDPKGKHGKAKMKKKGWCLPQYHDTMLYQGLYFDVDYDNADYNEGVNMLMELKQELESRGFNVWLNDRRRTEKARTYFNGLDMTNSNIVFSGSKGFHLIYEDWNYDRLLDKYADLYRWNHINNRQAFARDAKSELVDALKDDGSLLLDWEVTTDPRRIIRLPGTVHGKTLRLCKIVDSSEIKYDEATKEYVYDADDPIG